MKSSPLLPISVNKILLEHSRAHSFVVAMAALALLLQSCIVIIEGSIKQKIVTLWPFAEKAHQLLVQIMGK